MSSAKILLHLLVTILFELPKVSASNQQRQDGKEPATDDITAPLPIASLLHFFRCGLPGPLLVDATMQIAAIATCHEIVALRWTSLLHLCARSPLAAMVPSMTQTSDEDPKWS